MRGKKRREGKRVGKDKKEERKNEKV